MGESLLSSIALYTARPTLRIDGRMSELATGLMQAMTMHEQEGGLSSVEIVFVNWASRADGSAGPAFEDEALIHFGAALEVYAGDATGPTEIFSGAVSAMEIQLDADGPPRLVVGAEDAAQKARLARRIQVYENLSIADIARQVAGRMGLTPVVAALSDASAVEVQFNESDLAFLRRLLKRHDADAQVVGTELQVAKRSDVVRNTLHLQMNSQLVRVRIAADLADQTTELRVTGFDPIQGQAVSGLGSGAALGPGSGRTGSSQLQSAFGAREEQSAHRVALTSSEATALAEAEFAQRARRFVRASGECEGNPALRVGSNVTLAGVSPRFDNTYYVTASTHRFDQRRGYTTEFRAECAYLAGP